MRISPKKKGQIYDLVHQVIRDRRIEIMRDYTNYMTGINAKQADKIDYQIAQIEIPLAQEIIKLLVGETKEKI